MKKYITLLVLSLIVASSAFESNANLEIIPEEIEDIDILVLISDECGWNYFVVNETLEEMGVNVITLTNTESYTVTSCPSKEPRPITADLLLSELNLKTIDQYEGIVIPAGGQWQYVANDSAVHELLGVAYDNGLVIGTICNAGLVLGEVDIVTNRTKIVCPFPGAYQHLMDSGAIIAWEARVVSDTRIVTGGYGILPNGYETAPTYEVCLEMVKTIMGYSHASSVEVIPRNGTLSMECVVNVEIANLSLNLPGFNISQILQITAEVYPESNSSDITEVELVRFEGTNLYGGNFTASNSERHIIDLEIINEEQTYEVVKNATMLIPETQSNDIPLGSLLLLGGSGAIIAVVVFALWKRKT